jgi:zinc transport system substrate-binding protein
MLGGTRWSAAVAVVLAIGTACTAEADDRNTVVASFYPLAFVAERVAGDDWEVLDLTPPGTEAHDVELSLAARAAIEDAEVVLYLGDYGFQPQVEAAVEGATGTVVAVGDFVGANLRIDPHVWLDPGQMGRITNVVSESIPGGRVQPLQQELIALGNRYRSGLASCRFDVMIVPHEAFGYLADTYGLEQFGLAGVNPEAEPGADRLAQAHQLLTSGQAGAVFYEAGGESEDVAETVAADAGVPALPLSTLESEPQTGDYLSVMDENLASLRRGLDCG